MVSESSSWQKEWERNKKNGSWFECLILNLAKRARHRRLDYFTIQAFTAHGSFKKEADDECAYYGEEGLVEHMVFECFSSECEGSEGVRRGSDDRQHDGVMKKRKDQWRTDQGDALRHDECQ